MTVCHIGFLIASCAVLVGCATRRDVAAGCCAKYESPIFELNLYPELMLKGEPIVEISEDSHGASMRLNWSSNQHRIADARSYQRIKKEILASDLWKKQASASFYRGPWGGPPRDILTVRCGGKGINLQGSDVPRNWRRKLMRLAAVGRGTKLGVNTDASGGTKPER